MSDTALLEDADIAVAHAAAPLSHVPAIRMLGTLSEVADQPQLIALCSATLAAGIVRGDRRLARTGFRMLAAELVATMLKTAVKQRIDRTRPHVLHEGGDYAMRPGNSPDGKMSSFPSGHTAGAVAVARAVAREYPDMAAPSYTAAAAIAAIQIPRCAHYMSDIVAGAAVGLATDWLVAAAFDFADALTAEERAADR